MMLDPFCANACVHHAVFSCRFDILVNGGGSVTLQFVRQPFVEKRVTVMVPWNEMVTIETVTLLIVGEEAAAERVSAACDSVEHDYYVMRPVVMSTWQHTQLSACPSQSGLIAESQVRSAATDARIC